MPGVSFSPDIIDIAKKRVTQIFRYLENLNQLRNPAVVQIEEQPWRLWSRDLPDHESVALGGAPVRTQNEEADTGTPPESKSDGLLLRVRRPTLTRIPQPPDALTDWLQVGWDRFEGKRLTNTPVRQAGSVLKCPDDHKNRVVSAQATYPSGGSAVGGPVCE